MRFYDVLDIVQPQAKSFDRMEIFIWNAVKFFKNSFLMFRRNADAFIGDCQNKSPTFIASCDSNFHFPLAIFKSIFQQIVDDVFEVRFVNGDIVAFCL